MKGIGGANRQRRRESERYGAEEEGNQRKRETGGGALETTVMERGASVRLHQSWTRERTRGGGGFN